MRVNALEVIVQDNARLASASGQTTDTTFKEAFLAEFDYEYQNWKTELGNRDEVFASFVEEHRAEIKRVINGDLALKVIDEAKRFNYTKAIKIESIYVLAMLRLTVLGLERRHIIESYISELVRKKLAQVSCLCFRFGANGRIEVLFRFDRTEYAVLDGHGGLPCSSHMLANSAWYGPLNELEELINSPLTKEHDLQKFFEVYPELLFAKEYDTVIPQAVISPDAKEFAWKADFVLSPFNQFEFARIVELKLPAVRTTRTRNPSHTSFTAQVWHSLRQLKDYGDAFDHTRVRARFKDIYQVDIFKPDLHLVIGRSWDVNQIDTIKKMKRESGVNIETWDEMLARLKRQYS